MRHGIEMKGNATGRVFVVIHGGHVVNADVPQEADGTHTVIDWDYVEVDAEAEWRHFDAVDRAYIHAAYPVEFEAYFAGLEGARRRWGGV